MSPGNASHHSHTHHELGRGTAGPAAPTSSCSSSSSSPHDWSWPLTHSSPTSTSQHYPPHTHTHTLSAQGNLVPLNRCSSLSLRRSISTLSTVLLANSCPYHRGVSELPNCSNISPPPHTGHHSLHSHSPQLTLTMATYTTHTHAIDSWPATGNVLTNTTADKAMNCLPPGAPGRAALCPVS